MTIPRKHHHTHTPSPYLRLPLYLSSLPTHHQSPSLPSPISTSLKRHRSLSTDHAHPTQERRTRRSALLDAPTSPTLRSVWTCTWRKEGRREGLREGEGGRERRERVCERGVGAGACVVKVTFSDQMCTCIQSTYPQGTDLYLYIQPHRAFFSPSSVFPLDLPRVRGGFARELEEGDGASCEVLHLNMIHRIPRTAIVSCPLFASVSSDTREGRGEGGERASETESDKQTRSVDFVSPQLAE